MSQKSSKCSAVGKAVECKRCGRRKKPLGRSAPMEMASGLCDYECAGYAAPPAPGVLWPGETCEEFGYHCLNPPEDRR